mmetsp:Transcript_27866/g.47375  ORF Transcript_27866/g.47375 Transcript_27866/m.47375 type:complete len:405 (+) Transcript_27866:59-1273(+)
MKSEKQEYPNSIPATENAENSERAENSQNHDYSEQLAPPQAVSSYYAQTPVLQQVPHCMLPHAFHRQKSTGLGLSEGHLIQSSSPSGYHAHYLGATPEVGAGTPPLWLWPCPGFEVGLYHPVQDYSSCGQVYLHHGAYMPVPHSSYDAVRPLPGYIPTSTQVPDGIPCRGFGCACLALRDGVQAYPNEAIGYPQNYQEQPGVDHCVAPMNGQRRRGGRKPYTNDKHCRRLSGSDQANLFVFHIPNNMTDADLDKLFRPYGYVLSARIMTEKGTGRRRGFGFVRYSNNYSAAAAKTSLNGLKIHGKRLLVEYKKKAQSQTTQRDQVQSTVDDPRRSTPGLSSQECKNTTPLIPNIDCSAEPFLLAEGSLTDNSQGIQRDESSQSPLLSLDDIEKALPDTKNFLFS